MVLQSVVKEACTLLWALMDHNPQLMEDFTHANLEDPRAPSPASSAGAGPALMVRPTHGNPNPPAPVKCCATGGIRPSSDSLRIGALHACPNLNLWPVMQIAY